MNSAAPGQLDHLVIAARTLDEGVAWCEATLGMVPGPGGEHALFGTHNRLLRLSGAQAPRAYLEIIAVNPLATPTRPTPLKRWFDLDDPALQARLAQHGPQLVQWVASVPDIHAAARELAALGIDRGPVMAASRPTPTGPLHWRITVRDDGQRLFGGALPTLIQWGDTHPAATLPDSGLALRGLALSHPDATGLQQALNAVGLQQLAVAPGPAALSAAFDTPLGPRTLSSTD